ncbi:class IV adenylate cyclase [Criblamydia sequanensis]|uniref:Adenylate cyclase n=1 Tax=Candidatus Criblamydia sequanensis CRIB-18 TaxID=1437425 RepID=A0A090D085_9BACT|nr:class IV adenylate cyclase [Criblamydia sequanensis]CDR32968.1 Adenylate cyclase [Criblamydia sequanensis CRIB-18]
MKLNELEIKLQICSEEHFQEVFNSCIRLFGTAQSHMHQLDEYYDTPDGQLKKQDLVIRIRSNGEKKTIALKSPRVELPSGMTNRIELEFLSADGEKVHEQLASQGLNPNEAAEKERWTFVYNDCEIVLDKLPFIGSFIEIEGPSEIAINQIVFLLNLTSCSPVRQNYGELMVAKFRQLQLPLSNIRATFAHEIEYLAFK